MLRALFLLPLIVALGACRGETVDAPEDTGTGGPQTDAASDAAPAAGELLTNGGFESGCAGWNVHNGTLEDATDAHTGAASCRVCASGTYDFTVWQELSTPPLVGRTYVGQAYVRADGGDAGRARDPHAAVETWSAVASAPAVESAEGGPITLDPTWKRVSAALKVSKDAATIEFSVRAYDAGTCFLIDDASLRLAP